MRRFVTAAAFLALAAPALADQGVVTFVHNGYHNTCVVINGKWYTPEVAKKGGDPHDQEIEQRAWMTLLASRNAGRAVGFDVLGTAQPCKWGPAAEISDINDPPADGQ